MQRLFVTMTFVGDVPVHVCVYVCVWEKGKQSPSSLCTKGVFHLFSAQWPCSSLKVTTASQTWQMLNLNYNTNSHISGTI